jgi:hypothetical protein
MVPRLGFMMPDGSRQRIFRNTKGRMTMSLESTFHVSLDRIEENLAVVMTREGHQWLLPVGYLPDGAAGGDVLRVTVSVDEEETEKLAGRIHDLQQRLLDRTRERDAR